MGLPVAAVAGLGLAGKEALGRQLGSLQVVFDGDAALQGQLAGVVFAHFDAGQQQGLHVGHGHVALYADGVAAVAGQVGPAAGRRSRRACSLGRKAGAASGSANRG